jgi:hypothetical protein
MIKSKIVPEATVFYATHENTKVRLYSGALLQTQIIGFYNKPERMVEGARRTKSFLFALLFFKKDLLSHFRFTMRFGGCLVCTGDKYAPDKCHQRQSKRICREPGSRPRKSKTKSGIPITVFVRLAATKKVVCTKELYIRTGTCKGTLKL